MFVYYNVFNELSIFTHFVPFQHLFPQSQVFTCLLWSGAHPQAPIAQELGKSEVNAQQLAIVTVPPEATQALSSPFGFC
jgi:hypothetical protein